MASWKLKLYKFPILLHGNVSNFQKPIICLIVNPKKFKTILLLFPLLSGKNGRKTGRSFFGIKSAALEFWDYSIVQSFKSIFWIFLLESNLEIPFHRQILRLYFERKICVWNCLKFFFCIVQSFCLKENSEELVKINFSFGELFFITL